MGKVIPFCREADSESAVSSTLDVYRRYQEEATEISEGEIPQKVYIESALRAEDEPLSASKKRISIEGLYPEGETYASFPFRNAIQNLRKALDFIDEALTAEGRGKSITADDAMLHFSRLLPKLFCSRSLGDGFGIIINSIMIAIQNRQGDPLEASQILAIRDCIEKLKNQPFLSVEEAVQEVIVLEDKGLNSDLPELEYVADIPE